MSAWELTDVTGRLLLPPGLLILLGLIGLAFLRSWPRMGRSLAAFALISLYLLSTSIVARNLIRTLEVPYSDPAADRRAGAIVVLGAGSYLRAPEYGQDTVNRGSLERIRYAAHLQRRTRKPVLLSGGNPQGADSSEGAQMQAALREFGVSATWIEESSKNTFENARLARRQLERSGIKTIYLVTHAWHMPRARMAFERAGFNVIPAPTGYNTNLRIMVADFIPSTEALSVSGHFFHEIAGFAWYRLQFALGR